METKSNNQQKKEQIANYTITDFQNEIMRDVKDEIAKEDLETKGLFSRKMNIEKTLIQRIWYTIIVKMLGKFSLNIQIKRDGVVIFEYEIPKK